MASKVPNEIEQCLIKEAEQSVNLAADYGVACALVSIARSLSRLADAAEATLTEDDN